ncbi:unnamed protein product [Ambrosiozyma monospora]|uniref:Unnamed protein product n=1 Tax=Ambrosiozyma monospora TaxID=43982 RepID=A0ACB5UAM7_AMBMO|nr:unnamed protein product [Ambrosiozyma monospora]
MKHELAVFDRVVKGLEWRLEQKQVQQGGDGVGGGGKEGGVVYVANFELELSLNDLCSKKKFSFVPGFQSCLLGREYCVGLEFEFGKSKVKEQRVFANLPINVV